MAVWGAGGARVEKAQDPDIGSASLIQRVRPQSETSQTGSLGAWHSLCGLVLWACRRSWLSLWHVCICVVDHVCVHCTLSSIGKRDVRELSATLDSAAD